MADIETTNPRPTAPSIDTRRSVRNGLARALMEGYDHNREQMRFALLTADLTLDPPTRPRRAAHGGDGDEAHRRLRLPPLGTVGRSMTAWKLVGCLLVLLFVASFLYAIHDQEPPTSVHVVDPRGDVQWQAAPTTAAPTTTTTSTPPAVLERARTAPNVTEATWDAIAECESGGDWQDARGGYEGGLHFMNDTWVRAGGRRFAEHAYQATRAQQIAVAGAWLKVTSWRQWPTCSRKLRLR